MEDKGFQYVENFVCVNLNAAKLPIKASSKTKITKFFKKNFKENETSCED